MVGGVWGQGKGKDFVDLLRRHSLRTFLSISVPRKTKDLQSLGSLPVVEVFVIGPRQSPGVSVSSVSSPVVLS